MVSMLEAFAEVLSQPTVSAATSPLIREYLVHLTRVPRFSTVVLLMTPAEHSLVRQIWNNLVEDIQSNDTAKQQAKCAWHL